MADLEARAFVRRGGALFPADIAADEFLAAIPEGREVMVTIRRGRSVPQHRLMFGVLRKVVDNSEIWNDESELLDAVKLAVGHTELRMTLDGKGYRAPKSISFAAMGQDHFQRFFNRAMYVLGRMLGVAPETLLAEVRAEQPSLRSPSIVPSERAEQERADT